MFKQYHVRPFWDTSLALVGTVEILVNGILTELVSSGVKDSTGAPVATAGKFIRGAIIQNAVTGINYQNTGTTASPVWSVIGGGGAGIAIGDAITNADAGSILYVDSSGNLTQDALFTRTETETNISNLIDLGSGEEILASFSSINGANRMMGVYSISNVEQFATDILSDATEGEVHAYVNYILAGVAHGFKSKARASTIGDIAGGNGTYITVDDLNEKITVANVPTYADDAAAITGGLTTGMLYKTTTGGITALNIVP